MIKWDECILTIKGGKYMKVQNVGEELKLSIVDLQDEETVKICFNGMKMAFKFSHGDKCYFPKVEENSLKLELANDTSVLSKSHWFTREKAGGGVHYYLSVVSVVSGVEQKQYLCKKGSTLGLCQTEVQSFQVTHEKKN